MRISLQAELGDFQDRHTIYVFALKMSFLAVTLSSVVITLVLPPLDWMGMLPVPLAHGVVYGVLLSWLIGGAVSSMLSLVAGHAMHQLSVSRAEFEHLSRTDVLSGLLNRRAFTEALGQVDGNACLAIFDVDRFKAINDRFGHGCGDAVIVAVSAILAAAFDGHSVAGRLGGEEFGAIVVGGSQEQRIERVRSVCARLAAHPVVADDCVVALTVSAGIAELEPGRSKEGAYSAADKALYLAKALGRNRVVHENEGLHPGWRRHLPAEAAAARAMNMDCDEARLA
ncbi:MULTISPECIES: GGDEF domain-containing protein [unclassified Rhizobium]|uniref:GGDEF domain-containing protein n=1 Tax=unclassified Rhizobium TaxID=2613769 RepID=UPI000271BA09|nr:MULTISPECIES: GGDEF domain-containing protein [unclassified Rhizobium]EJL57089.1 diguanylate cyclase (GGDEF) domain-containing protein [Rhizobium sp. CF122]MBB3398442.1 diguanylate cyclase (GGDEF)-like protein [Rhizobium sp. BK060]MBB4171255.1 diguanylate cyclase (GGDEF)-like protein [Rhizobium sp. BK538]TCM68582.1 diguanylate cyclase (GGDEF)-like protein [Rhizobium sp. BK068]